MNLLFSLIFDNKIKYFFLTISKYVCVTFRTNEPASCFGKTLMWVKLSNSGDSLKLMIPNYCWKTICGWNNYPCMVISHMMSENKMGYRGSKSGIGNPQPNLISVKEQRVDVSCCIKSKLMLLRCTLTGFERNYQIKIPSKQLNNRSFFTLSHNANCLSTEWFITGLIHYTTH